MSTIYLCVHNIQRWFTNVLYNIFTHLQVVAPHLIFIKQWTICFLLVSRMLTKTYNEQRFEIVYQLRGTLATYNAFHVQLYNIWLAEKFGKPVG